jgi:hypothetical protein
MLFLYRFIFLVFLSLFLVGCGDSGSDFVFNAGTQPQPPQPPQNPPVASADTFTALGNFELDTSAVGGVLANDQLNGATITDNTQPANGTVTLNADGSFTYLPNNGFNGPDSFEYTLSNNDGASTATVTITVNNRALFVDNSAAGGGNGTQQAPFTDLQSTILAGNQGDVIFVFAGDSATTPYVFTGTATMKEGMRIVGEGVGLLVDENGINARIAAGALPRLTGPGVNRWIEMVNDTALEGLHFDLTGANDKNIFAVSKVNLTVRDCEFTNHDGGNLIFFEKNATTPGDFTITGNSITGIVNSGNLIEMKDIGPNTVNATISNNTIAGNVDDNVVRFEREVDCEGTTIANNNNFMIDGNEERCFEFSFEDGSTGSLVMMNNVVSTTRFAQIDLKRAQPGTTVTISDNQCTRVNDNKQGLEINVQRSQADFLITGNTFDGFDENIDVEVKDDSNVPSTVRMALRSNVLSNSQSYGLKAVCKDNSSLCMEIRDTTGVNNPVGLQLDQEDNATFQVEDPPLSTTNSVNGGTVETGTITKIAEGLCGL